MTKTAVNASGQSSRATEASHEANHAFQPEDTATYWYEKGIPNSVALDLERLYENFFSSYAKFNALKEADGACAYVVRKDGKPSTIFLFRNEGWRVHVLNEFIDIDGEEISYFAQGVFTRHPAVKVVSFRAIQPKLDAFPFPFQRYNCIEDIVLTLPATVQEYDKRLGKNMRKNIRTHLDRFTHAFPSFNFIIHETEETDEHDIRSIIRFNRERTLGKNKKLGIDKEDADKIVNMVKTCGMVATVKINGEICAGKLFFRVGDNYFSLLNAHSPQFNEFRLGTLCNYLSICECIRRGGKEYHFLWGREDFKYRFLGEQRDYDELVIYRSPLHMTLNARLAMKTAIEGKKRQMRLWMTDPERRDHPALMAARKLLKHARRNAQAA